jgi:hypothetical protein
MVKNRRKYEETVVVNNSATIVKQKQELPISFVGSKFFSADMELDCCVKLKDEMKVGL